MKQGNSFEMTRSNFTGQKHLIWAETIFTPYPSDSSLNKNSQPGFLRYSTHYMQYPTYLPYLYFWICDFSPFSPCAPSTNEAFGDINFTTGNLIWLASSTFFRLSLLSLKPFPFLLGNYGASRLHTPLRSGSRFKKMHAYRVDQCKKLKGFAMYSTDYIGFCN